MVQRSLPLLLLAGLLSCKGDPTGDLRNGTDHLLASPSSVFVGEDSTKFVIVTAVDEQGNSVATNFSDPEQVGPGITVVQDLTYQPVFDKNGNQGPGSDQSSVRYAVTADANTANSGFTIRAGGKAITIPVRIVPVVLPVPALAQPASPVVGDTLTLTIPAPYRWTSATTASVRTITPPVPPATKPDTVVRALEVLGFNADSSQLKVVPPPSLNGPIAVTNVVLGYAPAATAFSLTTGDTLKTAALAGNITLSTNNAVGGDTITVTAPGRFRFVATSGVTIGNAKVGITGISADSLQLRVAVGPSAADTVRVTGLQVSGAPNLGPFGFKALGTVTTPPAPPLTLNKTSAIAGDTIIVTAPAPYRFTPGSGGSNVTIGTAGKALIGISADSTQLRFLVGPSANSAVSATNMLISGAPAALSGLTLTSGAAVLTTPAIANFAGTFSTATPSATDTVTLTAPAGFKFLPTATVQNAGAGGLIVARAADSTSLRFVPARGAAASAVTVNGIVLSFLTSVSLTLPTAATLTPPAALAGTDAIATAPSITLPAVGASTVIYDGLAFGGTNAVSGGVGNKFYKITVPASTSVTVSMQWTNAADVDILFGLADGSDFLNCFGGATSSNPETGTCPLPAGDTILFANLFAGTAPGLLKVTLTRNN